MFNKGKNSLVNNYRPITILSTITKIFEIIIHEHVSHHLKTKFNLRQHALIRSKPKTTNIVAYLDLIIPQVHSPPQVDAILVYCDFRNAFYLVPHALLLRKLDDFGLSPT